MTGRPLSFDIFCRIIDNLGDAGVCWRLARQLVRHPAVNGPVRLWVDRLEVLRTLEPAVMTDALQQHCDGVDIIHWHDSAPDLEPHAIVIETFACDPPARFLAHMQRGRHCWISLDYLSAEPWVDTAHLRASLFAGGQRRWFFFPGFTPASGGLLREPGLLARRDTWQADAGARPRLLRALGLSADDVALANAGAAVVLLFAYPQAPVDALIHALESQDRPCLLLIPQGLYPGLIRPDGAALRVRRIPFLRQDDFDTLLWSCDLNIVRGEDSMVRALWAGRALIWQAYVQDADAHLDKLEAWLGHSALPAQAQDVMRAWNRLDGAATQQGLASLIAPARLEEWGQACRRWSARLSRQTDLVQRLLAFCAQGAHKA
ncbi:MAG: elongation factor P maturation arginine rhamnosyltransferase EarP [Castellaniella sp.]